MADRDDVKQSIRMTADRLLLMPNEETGDRKSRGGILIPATANVNRRLVWAEVVAVGPTVRNVEEGDRVLFAPDAGLRSRDPRRGVPHPARTRRPRGRVGRAKTGRPASTSDPRQDRRRLSGLALRFFVIFTGTAAGMRHRREAGRREPRVEVLDDRR